MSLLSTGWIQVGVRRSISDHCALILNSRNTYWGPKRFRAIDAWHQHPDFHGFVEDRWREMQIEGWAGYKCQQKLKLLKEDLKRWNKGAFGNVEAQVDKLSKQIEMLDKKSEEVELNEIELTIRRECFQEM
ncbi:hypothetical protein SLEP1_g28818 [Rubroshorea leprosula]|uniref:Uncharacterized protein n=1 Tax=Rubroshorea leprosula TaxID=152421 RepID=A0AAV5K5H6_9ROSI|nr:hypothetical protein SLEP1_g28818 [Rubroshorea leprosula]